ncbi:hypothetical protein QOL99_02980 [Deinococcus sp. MIMF12]|uniref:Uncharacterized protein n=1 Tax=Deinococcus rhizophilus TaxID=3049544 RepID=A0ABT7JDH7_9DEIO|nr:hypothetical protein [Deinococcus rhizophilus]MDL2343109.1 hypothetical protein [Deinococcus rhizophilus]
MALSTAAVIFEGDGRPALYLGTLSHAGHPQVFRVPEGVGVRVEVPHPLPEGPRRVFLPAGSGVTFEGDGTGQRLALHAVRAAREVIEALGTYAQARRVFEGSGPGEGGRGAA